MCRMGFRQKSPVGLLMMAEKAAQDLQGVIQNSSVTLSAVDASPESRSR